ncbi:MAG TPA: rhomboid family intramembrane serine protease [Chitinophagaceae bacterium]|nr:rhomboid family intramembrane serine protease [Chitinophagaceae bacterium]
MATKFESYISTGPLAPQQFIMLTSHACQRLGWEYVITAPDTLVAYTQWRMSGTNEQEINIEVNGNLATIVSKCISGELIDWGRNKKNVAMLTAAIEANRALFTAVQLQEQYEEHERSSDAAAGDFRRRMESGELTSAEKMSLGTGGYYVTYYLIGVCALVFVLMAVSGVNVLNPDAASIVNWGGNMRAYTVSGEWWRLITCMFVHVGIIHVLFNMYALYAVGLYLEPLLGRWRMLAAYLSTGTLASLASLWWSADRVSAGASGAIFGLYGIFLALLTTNLIDKRMRRGMLQNIVVFVIFNLVYGLREGIDNAAHAGGLVSGLVLGYVFFLMQKRPRILKAFPALVLAVAILASIQVLNMFPSDDSSRYREMMEELYAMDEKAMAPLSDDVVDESRIRQVEQVSIPALQSMQQKLKQSESFSLPADLQQHRQLFKRYTDLRMDFIQKRIYWYRADNVSFDSLAGETAVELNKVKWMLEQLPQ